MNLLLQYLTHSLQLSATWKAMKPHVHDILARCVFPLMCFSDEDAELWAEDPQEFIRKVSNEVHTVYVCCCAEVVSSILLHPGCTYCVVVIFVTQQCMYKLPSSHTVCVCLAMARCSRTSRVPAVLRCKKGYTVCIAAALSAPVIALHPQTAFLGPHSC